MLTLTCFHLCTLILILILILILTLTLTLTPTSPPSLCFPSSLTPLGGQMRGPARAGGVALR